MAKRRTMNRLNPELQIPENAPDNHVIVAIGEYVWGKGKTQQEAINNMFKENTKRKTDYVLHVCVDSKSENPVDGMGYISHCNPSKNCPHCK